MKPRQTVKNYHNSNAPPYQHLPNSTTPPTLRNIDLVKLGLNLDDMPNLQANNPGLSNQEEIVKCLQAFYGKNSATPATTSSKLPSLNDWPMQSVSPPDYSRIISGSGAGGSSGLTGGASFNDNSNNNNINSNKINISGANNNNPGQQQRQQDIHLSGSHLHSHQTSGINHHLRVSTTNIHSQQQIQQQQKQQKSVLSLHHQHHQNDLSNRRLSHHHMSTSNASFSNLNSVNATNAATTSSSTSLLDTNNLNNLSGGKVACGPICGGGGGGLPTHIMDTLGSMDNSRMYDVDMDNMLFMNKQNQKQAGQMGHHNLQKLLKATSSQPKSSSSSTLSHRSESQPQRTITSNNMPQSQLPISSHPASAISPPQTAYTSVPKSLLNLAACTSSSPSTNTSLPSASKFSSMVSQLNMMSARNASATNQTNLNNNNNNINNNNNASNIRSFAKISLSGNNSGGNNDGLNQKGSSNGNDHNNLLQHMARSNNTSLPHNVPPTTRSGSKQIQFSLLSEDQSPANRSTGKTMCNVNSGTNQKPQSSTSKMSAPPGGASSKEAYLASLQERAARAGVSIGEINKPIPSTNLKAPTHSNNNTTNSPTTSTNITATNPLVQPHTFIISPNNQNKGEYMNPVDRNEIESALSRVEARNDLSLLYPPMLLASNSQKQINALSAGLEGAEDSELFTKEVKKIVLEECNIIYECKGCNNLFRSLANLVKHKRTYCIENSSGRNSLEMNRRSYVNPNNVPIDQQATTIYNSTIVEATQQQNSEVDRENSVTGLENRASNESSLLSSSYNNNNDNNYNSSNYDRRNNLSNMIRFIQNQEKGVQRLRGQQNNGAANASNPVPQTSLSKLLQSQPKNRLPVSRDSALIGALNATSISSSKENLLSALESDKKINCSPNEVHEQLVRNSSLAKTLLNEKVRVSNPKQSLGELPKVEEPAQQPRTSKRVAPKRKFLEDCIKKVKRDKLLTEGEEDEEASHSVETAGISSANAANVESINPQQTNKEPQLDEQDPSLTSDISKFNSPGDSGDDSDMLTIDLDGPKLRTPAKKAKRKICTTVSSQASSSSSVKLNTSSALLKALTRPVDTRRTFNTSSVVPCNDKMISQGLQEPSKEKSPVDETTTTTSAPDQSSPLFPFYTCDYCDLDVEDPADMTDHMLRFHSDMMIIFPCLFCSFSFISIENVCRHILEIHKKPRAQINRLRDVVRSRSFEHPDFSACRDCPHPATIEKIKLASKKATSELDATLDLKPNTSLTANNPASKFEGMKTRGKKRVDYNQMINNNDSDSGPSSKWRKDGGKNADQQVSVDNLSRVGNDDVPHKAASISSDLMETDDRNQEVLVQRGTPINMSPSKQAEHMADGNIPPSETSQEGHLEINSSANGGECLDKPLSKGQNNELVGEHHHQQEDQGDEVEGTKTDANCKEEPLLDGSTEMSGDTDNVVSEENASDNLVLDEDSTDAGENPEVEGGVDEESNACDEAGRSDDDDDDNSSTSSASSSSSSSSSTSSSSQSSSRSSSTSTSGSSSSSTKSSSLNSNHQQESLNDDEPQASTTKQAAPATPLSSTDMLLDFFDVGDSQLSNSDDDSSRLGQIDEQVPASKHPSSRRGEVPRKNDDSVTESEVIDDDSNSQPQQAKQNTTQRPTSSTKSNPELTTPSSNSSTGGGGGIMKLKIQLKTRPDEKSKVYEIV